MQPKTTYLKDYTVPDYLIAQCDLEFELNEDFTRVKSFLKMHRNPASTSATQELILDGEMMELESVMLNQKKLQPNEYEISSESLMILNVPSEFNLEIVTRIKPQENKALSGLYKSSGNFCTQCEAHGFRRITYFLDRPDVMTKFTTKITADEKRYPVLLSNGNPIEKGKNNGKHWVKWEDPFKKPSYLFALVAGDLECVEDFFITQSGRRITLQIYVEKGNRDQCDHAMQSVKEAMRWDETHFGREYDLDIYMIVAVSDFNMGAMENKGLNIFNTKYILATPESATDNDFIYVSSVIAHEYFHNWSGNRVTCRDWFQLSLKEGLTIFRDQSFTADTTSKTVARINDVISLRNAQFPEDAGPLSHPVQPSSYIEINNFYTATVYNKGAEVIRMMKTILGDDLFRKGMDLYFSHNDGHAVTIEEFVKAMEDASKIDLTQFRLWYSQSGTPFVDVTDEYDAANKKYKLMVKQNYLPNQKSFHIPVKIGLLDSTGAEIKIKNNLLNLKNATETFEFENIASRPIPSLLRHFSAPVKLRYNYSDESLQLLFKHDSDGFNRWEAGQRYATNCLFRMMEEFKKGKSLQVPNGFIETFQHVLRTQQNDKLLLTRLLILPNEKYLCEQMDVIDVDAVRSVREFLLKEIAEKLEGDFTAVFKENNQDTIECRQLKNLALFYLLKLKKHIPLAEKQFNESLNINMTNTIAALNALIEIDGDERDKALAAFYQKWKDDALVVDKWFTLQASSFSLEKMMQLMKHPAFDLKNPNKVYALIAPFCRSNLINFHAINGSGYQFLTNIVLQLNDFNPQIAARMVTPLTEWKRYDEKRQALMREQLEIILQKKNLSKDVYELVTKSLGEKIYV